MKTQTLFLFAQDVLFALAFTLVSDGAAAEVSTAQTISPAGKLEPSGPSYEVSQSTPKNALWQTRHPTEDRHAEALRYRRLRLQDEHGQIPPDAWVKAAQQKKQMPYNPAAWSRFRAPEKPTPGANGHDKPGPSVSPKPMIAGIEPSGWTWLGPGNIGGRVRSILIHPTNPSIMWVGGVDGGVWKTTTGGANWFPLDDFMPNLAISCMVMDPKNPDVIYAGTGEFLAKDGIRGAGVFKTTDGGVTWEQLSSAAPFEFINRLAISPTDSRIILASTPWNGINRSTDGGLSWTPVTNDYATDLAFDPTDGSKCIAAGPILVLFSNDGGVTWTNATGISGAGGIEVAYAPSSPSTVYASVDENGGDLYLYRSLDGGQTYSLVSTKSKFFLNPGVDQGIYDNCIWVDPTNPNILVVGGLDLWRSTDGGSTLNDITSGAIGPGVHTDQHAIVSPANFNGTTVKTVFVGNDGGVFMTTDIYGASGFSGPWTALNNNLGITQFYGVAVNSITGTIVGGTQDNGTLRLLRGGGTASWTTWGDGDGGFCASDPTDSNYFYGEYVYLAIFRSTDGAGSSSDISGGGVCNSGIGDANNPATALFVAPFVLDPENPQTMLAGGSSLWRTTNLKDIFCGPSWSVIKPSRAPFLISAIAIAPYNSDVVWVGYNDGSVFATTNGTAPTPIWSQKNPGTMNWPKRVCTCIAVDPNTRDEVYVTFGGFTGFTSNNVWRTTDGGATWANVSANLPQAPVNSLVTDPHDSNYIYIGTEVGVFASDNAGASWSPSNDGPANVDVEQLAWLGDTLVAATHGRGMFAIQPIVWVDFNYSGTPQTGSFATPFEFLAQGISAVSAGGEIFIRTAGLSHETLTISKPVTIRAFAGQATIGQ